MSSKEKAKDKEKEKSKSKTKNKDQEKSKDKEVNKSQDSKVHLKTESSISKKSKSLKIKIPKNVNDYKHIIKNPFSRESDIQWILELRGYNKIRGIPHTNGNNSPHFYDEDLVNYKKKNNYANNRKFLRTNFAVFDHVIDHPAGLPANDILFKYEQMLRHYETENNKGATGEKKPIFINPLPWKSLALPSQKSLLDTYLPPILKPSKERLDRLGEIVSRPIVQVNTSSTINGQPVKQRKFELSPEFTSRYPQDHHPSVKYNNNFKIKNIGTIAHMLNFDNINASTLWGAGLRSYEKMTAKTEVNEKH